MANETNTQPALPALVPIRQSKRVFGWSVSTSYRLKDQGLLVLRKIGRGRFIETSSALRLIKNSPSE